jgi:ElaB/YqjD/DUF883 family membrane-anchored ribosome-binding protein
MTDRAGEKRPEEIEDEIARTRADMDSTLDAIQRRLSPSELVDQAMNYVKQNGAQEMLGGLGRAVRDNPVPIALIGLGCAWLLYSTATSRREDAYSGHGDEFDETYAGANGSRGNGHSRFSGVRERASEVAASASGMAGAAGESIREAWSATEERGQRLGEYARGGASRAQESYRTLLRERPLALGAIGLAIGAAVGLLLPSTRREDEALGEYRDQIFEQAQAAGREHVHKAQSVATEAWRAAKETAKEEAAKQGLAGEQSSRPEEQRQQTAGVASALAE